MGTEGNQEATCSSSARVCARVSKGRTRNDVSMAHLRQETDDTAPRTYQAHTRQTKGVLVTDARGVFAQEYMVSSTVQGVLDGMLCAGLHQEQTQGYSLFRYQALEGRTIVRLVVLWFSGIVLSQLWCRWQVFEGHRMSRYLSLIHI